VYSGTQDVCRLPGYGLPPLAQMALGTKLRIDYVVQGDAGELKTGINFNLGDNWSGAPNYYAGTSTSNAVASGATNNSQWFVAHIWKTNTKTYGDVFGFSGSSTCLPANPTAVDLWVSLLPEELLNPAVLPT
jgi:hypothetical protein